MNTTASIVGQTRMVRIARFLGEEGAKKVFINSKGEQFTLPDALRDDAEEGDYCIVIGKTYFAQAIDPATGQKAFTPEGQVMVDTSKPFERWDALKVGDYNTITEDYYAEDVVDAARADRVKELTTGFKAARKAAPKVVKGANAEPANVGN